LSVVFTHSSSSNSGPTSVPMVTTFSSSTTRPSVFTT
jgi:hypothetical protein